MKFEKQDVGVWVKADEEPEKSSVYHVKINSFDCKAMLLFSKELGWMYNESERVLQKDTPSHWLKPIKDVFLLTEDELEEFKNEQTGALIKRLGEIIVERDKLKKDLEQEQFNHLNTRSCWDVSLQERDNKDLIIAGIEEGSELWKAEYDNCRELLDRLVILKECKDANINMEEYAVEKPKAWEAAKEFLKKYQHQ